MRRVWLVAIAGLPLIGVLTATIAQASPNLGGSVSPIQRALDDVQRSGTPNFFQQGRDRFESEVQQLNQARSGDLLHVRPPALQPDLPPPNYPIPNSKRL